MSSRRTAILIGAIAVGIVAVVLIWSYVRSIEDGLYQDSQPAQVYLAKQEVPRGTDGQVALDSKLIDLATVPEKFKPSTAISSSDALQAKVALFDIAPGTIIVDKMFVDPATSQISFRQRLKNRNHVAISVQVDQVKGVGGFLGPGDEVNMMMYQDNSLLKTALDGTAPGNSQLVPSDIASEIAKYQGNHGAQTVVQQGGPQWIILDKTARYLYQKVQILAVGSQQLLSPGEQAASGTPTTAQAQNNTGLITFNVPPEAAQWIATGADKGFYLSLVPKDYRPTPIGPLPIIVDQLPGENPAILCPYYNNDTKSPECSAQG